MQFPRQDVSCDVYQAQQRAFRKLTEVVEAFENFQCESIIFNATDLNFELRNPTFFGRRMPMPVPTSTTGSQDSTDIHGDDENGEETSEDSEDFLEQDDGKMCDTPSRNGTYDENIQESAGSPNSKGLSSTSSEEEEDLKSGVKLSFPLVPMRKKILSTKSKTQHENVTFEQVGKKRSSLDFLKQSRPTKRRRLQIPRRYQGEDNVMLAFRALGYLQGIGCISDAQVRQCRRLLINDVGQGLLTALMAFTLDKNERDIANYIYQVAPRPSLSGFFIDCLRSEARRVTMRAVGMAVLKGASYAFAFSIGGAIFGNRFPGTPT